MNRVRSDNVFAFCVSTKRRVFNNSTERPRATPRNASMRKNAYCLWLRRTIQGRAFYWDAKTDNTHREVASVPYGRC